MLSGKQGIFTRGTALQEHIFWRNCFSRSQQLRAACLQKNPRAHKNKIGIPPPQTPPLKGGILRTWFFLQRERIFPGVHKIGAAISGPRIADTNFADTWIFLNIVCRTKLPRKTFKSIRKTV